MIIQSQTIVHRALLDYFRQITTRTALFEAKGLLKESSAEVAGGHDQSSVVTELIDVVKDHLVHILHTREGSQVTQLAILHASPKQRKAIIKTLKGFVKKIAMEQYGSACLLSLFECVDDTVLVGKSVIGELIGDGGEGNAVDDGFESLMRDKYASQVILYLLAGGRNKSYVTGSVVDELMKMDDVRAITSKKDIAVKQAELVKHLIPVLVPALKSCVGVLMRCKVGSVVMLETVKFCSRSATVVDGFQEFVDAIAGTATGVFACDDEVVEKTGAKRAFNAVQNMRDAALKTKQTDSGLDMSLHVIVNRVSAMMLKSMVVNKLKGEDVGVASPIVGSLSEAIGPNLGFWMDYCVQDPKGSNATGFVLLALWESEGGDGIREEMKKVGIDGARVAQWRVGEDKFEKSAKETGVEKLVGAMSK
jgi:pumilio family protein 6